MVESQSMGRVVICWDGISYNSVTTRVLNFVALLRQVRQVKPDTRVRLAPVEKSGLMLNQVQQQPPRSLHVRDLEVRMCVK